MILIFGHFCLSTSSMNAQTYSNEDTSEVEEINVDTNDAQISVLFQSLGIDNTANPKNNELLGSNIFLQQIGDFNTSTINVIADTSEINLLQNGTANDASLTYEAKSVFTEIQQNGNDNNVIDFAINNPLEDISLNLQQNGSNLNFERVGTNSLTRSMSFIQTAASPSLIIRSFN